MQQQYMPDVPYENIWLGHPKGWFLFYKSIFVMLMIKVYD